VRTFYDAVARIEEHGYVVLRTSSLYDTEPWGGAEGGSFINAVYEIERHNNALQFMQDLLSVEADLGRRRSKPIAARSCDLDLLLWANEVIDTPTLCVPHPRIPERKFVLIPLCELIADCLHPVLKTTFAELLLACDDLTPVRAHQA
jgi:2-amino-4-hydroxy-6-hydroxymethyldihydropteridine diphosphokinase